MGNQIHTLNEVYDTVPKTVVARDLGFNSDRITKLFNNVELFYLKDLFKLADLVEVDEMDILKLVCNQYQLDKKTRRRKGKTGD